MSKQNGVLELEVAGDRALIACREVFDDLAWDVLVDGDGVIVAREDATRLSCHQQPATTELRIDARANGNPRATIDPPTQ